MLFRSDELSLDPRAYDHGHPVNQRPGYQFGEWDPHRIDNHGFYRRFIVRPLILDALVDWPAQHPDEAPEETLFESAAALAGTILLASGVSGSGPDTHGSEINLAVLVPKIARCRDAFYDDLLRRTTGARALRLREDATRSRQPFGGIRQYLNRYVSRQRSIQLQRDRLARIYARMGFSDASRRQAQAIAAPSIRLRSELECQLATGRRLLDEGRVADAAETTRAVDDVLHRAIECGALVDPWNILGFAGNYSLFPAAENSVLDPRVEQLLELMQAIFAWYGRLLCESAVFGDAALHTRLETDLRQIGRAHV